MPETESKYRVIGLEVSNFKRIKAVEIAPVGNLVKIGGRNDQGKSSLLDSIMAVLAGAGFKCEMPLRKGAKEGHIVMTLRKGDLTLVATKRFRANGAPSLVVTMDDCAVKSPQSILDEFCNNIGFDPLKFANMERKPQMETLREIVGLDFTELDSRRKTSYDQRTAANRELSSAEAKLRGMAVLVEAPDQEVSAKDLLRELNRAIISNQGNKECRVELALAEQFLERHYDNIKAIEKQIEELQTEISKEIELRHMKAVEIEGLKYRNAKLVDVDTAAISARIEQVDETNLKVRANRARIDAKAVIADHVTRVGKLTTEIESIDSTKASKLSAAKFPLPGLSFDDAGVLMNGVPFDQLGTAHKILASVAIAHALNPQQPAILIRDGSLLDDDSMAALEGYAKEHDLMVFCEIVGEGKNCSLIIEDGVQKES